MVEPFCADSASVPSARWICQNRDHLPKRRVAAIVATQQSVLGLFFRTSSVALRCSSLAALQRVLEQLSPLTQGRSDPIGDRPAANPVTPADLTATMYHALGVPHDLAVHDRQDRPIPLTAGKPLIELF